MIIVPDVTGTINQAYEIANQITGYLGINCYDNVLQKVSGIQAKV